MKNILFVISAAVLLLSLGCLGCQPDNKSNTTPTKQPTPTVKPSKKIKVPKFNRDSAYQFVARQVAFGPRVPNTAAHTACKEYLIKKLAEFGAIVIAQEFEAPAYTGTILKATNIIGQFNPSAKKRIVLAAHWDSRHIADHDPDESNRTEPVMGADDGASGVGVLLEVARQLGANPLGNIGIDIIFFDAEDYGNDSGEDRDSWALGSQYWSRNFHVNGYQAEYGILLDMVGGKNARFPIEGTSAKFAPNIVRKVWRLARDMGYSDYFSDQNVGGITDDHFFVNTIARIPMVDIINLPMDAGQTFVKHWHTTNDTMEHIDKRTLRAVGQVVLAVIYNEAMGRL